MTLAIDLAIRSSVLLGIGLLLAVALPHRSAAVRHCVLAAAVGAAILVVPFSLALPGWEVRLPVRATPAAVETAPAVTAPSIATHVVASATPARTIARLPSFAAVWIAGFLVGAFVLLIGIARLLRIAARSRRVHDARRLRIAAEVATGYGISREYVLLESEASDLIATWGLLRPRVLLPVNAREWTEDRLRVVLSHELAHVRRCDWLVQSAAEALRTVLWFNPLIWIVCARLRRESEQACDDAVLARGIAGRDYAVHLLDLVRQCRHPRFPRPSAISMAHPSTLERRIAAMLNPRLNRRALSGRAVAATAALLLAVTLPTAALRAGQGTPGVLSGSVYDPTGGVLPGVKLTLEDGQNNTWPVVTDATGHFEFPGVQPGRYVFEASLPGFRSLRQEFELRNSGDWDRAITLQVGDLRETITVRETRVAPPALPSQPHAPQPVRVGGNIRVPKKILDVKPVYPPSMRAAGREGVVPIEAIIDRDGNVSTVRVLSAEVHPDFAIAAVDAVRQWRFTPTLLNGAPVEVVMTVSVTFNLSD